MMPWDLGVLGSNIFIYPGMCDLKVSCTMGCFFLLGPFSFAFKPCLVPSPVISFRNPVEIPCAQEYICNIFPIVKYLFG